MSEDLTNQTRLNLATAKDAYRQALAKAELLEIEVLEARQAAELASAKASRLSKVLEILDSDYVPEPSPAPVERQAPVPQGQVQQPPDPEPGLSVADQIAAKAAAGDELASRTVDESGPEDRNAPPPSNVPQAGPACTGCGRQGTLGMSQIMVGDRGPFPAVVCNYCGHQKAMI
jgi:hypothetical protein